jgi:hypothetical protein
MMNLKKQIDMEYDPHVLKKNAQAISDKFGLKYGITYDKAVCLLYRNSFDPAEVVAHIERAINGGEDPVGRITEKEQPNVGSNRARTNLCFKKKTDYTLLTKISHGDK